MVTDDVLDDESEFVEFLLGLVHQKQVVLDRYSESGPPPDAQRVREDRLYVPGWVVYEPRPEDPSETILGRIYTAHGDSGTLSAVWGSDAALRGDRHASVFADLVPDTAQAIASASADLLTDRICEATGAHLCITKRPLLLHLTRTRNPRSAVKYVAVDPAQALPIVGMYLRSLGLFLVDVRPDGSGSHRVDRPLFYWLATRSLLPGTWRWTAACAQLAEARSDRSLAWTSAAFHQRIARALRARDLVHAALSSPQDAAMRDEAVDQFDTMVLALMGALDAAARATDRLLGIGTKRHLIGWHKQIWRDQLEHHGHAALAARLAPGTSGFAALRTLAALRNTIHGEPLRPVTSLVPDRLSRRTLLRLPSVDAHELLPHLEALGGEVQWGVQSLGAFDVHADIQAVTRGLFKWIPQIIDNALDDVGQTIQGVPQVEPSNWLEALVTNSEVHIRVLGQMGLSSVTTRPADR
jgi:hypothetical protein